MAGLYTWRLGRFDLYCVNTPLTRMAAALPVIAVGYDDDWSDYFSSPGARPEFKMGEAFVAANGTRSSFIFMIARWACIPFSWIGAIVCYMWAKDLYGRPSGVVACAIWCFEPNILAHASLITADITATALSCAACYTFWRWLKNPKWAETAVSAVALGVAELAKTTLIVFYPLLPLMWIVYRWFDRHSMSPRDWLREAGMLFIQVAMSLYILNLGYGFDGSLTQLKSFHFVSNLFAGQQSPSTTQDAAKRLEPPINRFAVTTIGDLPVPLPKSYVLGLDLQQRDFESYDRPSYLWGNWRASGWWYYYIVALAIKMPLGIWLFVFLFAIAQGYSYCCRRLTAPVTIKRRSSASFAYAGPSGARSHVTIRDQFVLLFPGFAIFAAVSCKTGFSEHLRYILPVFPFLFVWVSQILLTPQSCSDTNVWGVRGRAPHVVLGFSSVVAVFWLITSSLWIYPHSLSYFNELIGGPLSAPKFLLGSNLDWGQDLFYLEHACQLIPQSQRLHLAYFGAIDPIDGILAGAEAVKPADSLGRAVLRASSNGVNLGRNAPRETRWIAISVNCLHGDPWPARDGAHVSPKRPDEHLIKSLRYMQPTKMIGYSICMYCISNELGDSAFNDRY